MGGGPFSCWFPLPVMEGKRGNPIFPGRRKRTLSAPWGKREWDIGTRGLMFGGAGEAGGRDGAAFSPGLAARGRDYTVFSQGLRRSGQGKRRHGLPPGTCVKRGQRGGRGLLLRTCARGARGELGGPFFGVRAGGGKGKRWGWSFSRGLRWERPGRGGCGPSSGVCARRDRGKR